MDLAYEVFDYIFKLFLAFDDIADAAEVERALVFFNQDDGVGLCHVIGVEALGGLGLDAHV